MKMTQTGGGRDDEEESYFFTLGMVAFGTFVALGVISMCLRDMWKRKRIAREQRERLSLLLEKKGEEKKMLAEQKIEELLGAGFKLKQQNNRRANLNDTEDAATVLDAENGMNNAGVSNEPNGLQEGGEHQHISSSEDIPNTSSEVEASQNISRRERANNGSSLPADIAEFLHRFCPSTRMSGPLPELKKRCEDALGEVVVTVLKVLEASSTRKEALYAVLDNRVSISPALRHIVKEEEDETDGSVVPRTEKQGDGSEEENNKPRQLVGKLSSERSASPIMSPERWNGHTAEEVHEPPNKSWPSLARIAKLTKNQSENPAAEETRKQSSTVATPSIAAQRGPSSPKPRFSLITPGRRSSSLGSPSSVPSFASSGSKKRSSKMNSDSKKTRVHSAERVKDDVDDRTDSQMHVDPEQNIRYALAEALRNFEETAAETKKELARAAAEICAVPENVEFCRQVSQMGLTTFNAIYRATLDLIRTERCFVDVSVIDAHMTSSLAQGQSQKISEKDLAAVSPQEIEVIVVDENAIGDEEKQTQRSAADRIDENPEKHQQNQNYKPHNAITKLYIDGILVHPQLKALLDNIAKEFRDQVVEARMAPLKKLFRSLEKFVFLDAEDAADKTPCKAKNHLHSGDSTRISNEARPEDHQRLCDVVRGSIVCRSMRCLNEAVSRLLKNEQVIVTRIKDRFTSPTEGGWADLLVNLYFRNDPQKHIVEVQFIHEKLLIQRKGVGGHHWYASYRSASEYVEFATLTQKDSKTAARIQEVGELQFEEPLPTLLQIADDSTELQQKDGKKNDEDSFRIKSEHEKTSTSDQQESTRSVGNICVSTSLAAKMTLRSDRPSSQGATSVTRDPCPICLTSEEKNVALVPCGHLFCTKCADSLVLTVGETKCPVCRKPVMSSMKIYG